MISTKKTLLILTCFLIFGIGVLFAITYPSFLNFRHDTPIARPILSSFLSQEEYHTLAETLADMVSKTNPKIALDNLHTLMNIDEKVLRSCHGLVHEIGNAAYKKYGNFTDAIKFQDDLCGSGYIHGVIEASFEHVSSDAILDVLKHTCSNFRGTDVRACYHGVGHGLMYYTDNDVPRALSYCDTYSNQDYRIRCAEGVFMENFSTDEAAHESNYLNPSDPFFPCQDQKNFYKDVCYFYSPVYFLSLHENSYIGALQWCTTAGVHASACARGVGSRVTKENIQNTELMEAACMSQSTLTASCIDGMVSYYIVNFSSTSKADKLCEKLSPENSLICKRSITNRETRFLQ